MGSAWSFKDATKSPHPAEALTGSSKGSQCSAECINGGLFGVVGFRGLGFRVYLGFKDLGFRAYGFKAFGV